MDVKRYVDIEKLDRIFPNAYFDMSMGCAEPGYDDMPVILADWNHVPQVVFDRLESLGYLCEWLDEWISCDDCGRVFRSSPNSYHWEMAGIIGDGWCCCLDCMNPQEYMESIENDPRKALTWCITKRHDPTDYGYELVQDKLENGWYDGQNDDPESILAAALEKYPNGRFIFAITDQGQFDVEFSLYRRLED